MNLMKVIVLSQLTGHIIWLLSSLCIIIPMSMHEIQFNGSCLLFTTGEWYYYNGAIKLVADWAPRFYCIYVNFLGVFQLIVCALQIYRSLKFYFKDEVASFLILFLEAVSYVILCVLTMASAVIVTLGLMSWCHTVAKKFWSCGDAAGQILTDGVSSKGFYVEMQMVQFGAWAAFTTCVAMAYFSILKVWHFHMLENTSGEQRSLLNRNRSTLE
ncbi:transmembrane protein 179-like [Anticarsia gemmatalis]|uniref:transmembrane protein 179-like n=1 Tax=Anticarsia gemmatalis TaxID=129554 RepID=UPI003F76828A